MEIPFPLIGDFLWFLEDEAGCYCVNWTIKGSREDFAISPQFSSPVMPATKATGAAWKASMRHGIEEIYYLDFGIRTQRITRDDYSRALVNNLAQIFGWIHRPVALPEAVQKKIFNWLCVALSTGIPPFQMWSELASTERVSLYDVKYVMYRAIWERQLKVDLFQPIHIDWPLLPEKRDALDVYAEWFRR
ncbi:PDDEXK family nuclease [Duganella sp. PWIR1]